MKTVLVKSLTSLFVALTLVASLSSCALLDGVLGGLGGGGNKGGKVVYDTIGMYAVVVGYEGNPTELTIAATYNGLPVSFIQRGAFSDCTTLTKIFIPASVNAISPWAFSGCDNLVSASFGSTTYYCPNCEIRLDTAVSSPESAARVLTEDHVGCGIARP